MIYGFDIPFDFCLHSGEDLPLSQMSKFMFDMRRDKRSTKKNTKTMLVVQNEHSQPTTPISMRRHSNGASFRRTVMIKTPSSLVATGSPPLSKSGSKTRWLNQDMISSAEEIVIQKQQ